MKRYPRPKLDATMHFSTLKTAFKIEQKNVKSRKIANILKNG